MQSLSREKCREIDRRAIERYGMSGLVLMENAGRATADLLIRLLGQRHATERPRVLVCCGRGNNGGDGFVIARHLDLRGIDVQVLFFAEPQRLTGDALTNFEILERSAMPLEVVSAEIGKADLDHRLSGASWIVDCLLGTGAQGEPRPPLDLGIDCMNAASAKRLAVDLPSGFDCDSGTPARHTIQADATATFVAMKLGFLSSDARRYTGDIYILDIGAPRRLIEEMGIDFKPSAL